MLPMKILKSATFCWAQAAGIGAQLQRANALLRTTQVGFLPNLLQDPKDPGRGPPPGSNLSSVVPEAQKKKKTSVTKPFRSSLL